VTKSINIHEAKTHLSRLVEQAALGKEIIIAKAGKPMARLVPLENAPRPKKFGLLEGSFQVPADFDTPLDAQVLALFEGS
jgi:prevent-host-death family protein